MAGPDVTIEVMSTAKRFQIIGPDSWTQLKILFETFQNSRAGAEL